MLKRNIILSSIITFAFVYGLVLFLLRPEAEVVTLPAEPGFIEAQDTRAAKQAGFASNPKVTAVVEREDGRNAQQESVATERPSLQEADATETPAAMDKGDVISGWVMNEEGVRLPDIEVVASARRLFLAHRNGLSGAGASEQRTRTDELGSFHFASLAKGEYTLRAEALSPYQIASVVTRSGVETVSLTVPLERTLWVEGVVTDTDGQPLSGVEVMPNEQSLHWTLTDAKGTYSVNFPRHGGDQRYDTLHFTLHGYQAKRVTIPAEAGQRADRFEQAAVRLVPIEGWAAVQGQVVAAADGAPIPGAHCFLRPKDQGESMQTVTDEQGQFALEAVAFGDYRLIVSARQAYADFTNEALQVGAAGVTDLHIELEPLASGRLQGLIVNAAGDPVPGFSLWLSSENARAQRAQPVTSDQHGNFAVDNVPRGELRLVTHSSPYLRITGLHHTPGEPLLLPVDWGEAKLRGQVLDRQGHPLSGTRVTLLWLQREGEVQSRTSRNTSTDASGFFHFSQLGPSSHDLEVNVQGYRRSRTTHPPGSDMGDLRIRLEPLIR